MTFAAAKEVDSQATNAELGLASPAIAPAACHLLRE
jgi:hypothetical protein